jgi:hypothetical protein
MLDSIFDAISKTESCYYADANSLSNKSLRFYDKIIGIDTEITFQGKLLEVKLYVALPFNLEVNLPKVFIDEKSYEPIKYIPHINSDLSICILDESENFYYDLEQLPGIVLSLIKKSKEVIRSSEDKEFITEEFQREFQAYWGISYSIKDKEKEIGLSLIDTGIESEIRAIKFKKKVGQYEFLIYNHEEYFNRFTTYLKLKGISYFEIPLFCIDFKKDAPPFDLSYVNSVSYLQSLNKTDIKKVFNKSAGGDFLVIFKNRFHEYYGWTYPTFSFLPNGFRKKSNWEKIQLQVSSCVYVERITFSNITPGRLYQRTSGNVTQSNKSINLVGLGSVGSNLLHYLSKLPISKIALVDKEALKIENIFRHNYGFDYVSRSKARITEKDLANKNPFIKINTYEKDIIEVVQEHPTFFNDADFSFIIIGVTRIEVYLLEYMMKNHVEKPIFIMWVEPYLASGKLIYICPSDYGRAKEVLLNSSQQRVLINNGRLYLKEGSCQTGYYPYSETYLALFLSSIFPYIYNTIVKGKDSESKVYTWVGDLDYLSSLGLEYIQIGESFSLKIENL